MQDNEQRMKPRHWRVQMAVAALLVFLLGCWASQWYSRRADHILREELLNQAESIALTISPELVRPLSFSPADLDIPQFQRIGEYMRTYAANAGLHSIYSMTLKDGDIVFGPESLAGGHPEASPPGTVYRQPAAIHFSIFESGAPVTFGPVQDEYGRYISALAPVMDPASGKAMMVVGVDMKADAWEAALRRARRGPMVFTALLLCVIFLGCAVLEWRGRLGVDRQWRLRHVEAVFCLVLGLLFTLGAALVAHQAENWAFKDSFENLSRAQSAGVNESMRDVQGRLHDLGRFFEGSDWVNREEFRAFTAPLTQEGIAEIWGWIQDIAPGEVARLGQIALESGLENLNLWRMDGEGGQLPVTGEQSSHAVLFVEPLLENRPLVGLDIGAEPLRCAAMEEARRSGMSTAAEPVPLLGAEGQPEGIIVFHPVTVGRQKGFVAAGFLLDTLLQRSLRRSGAEVDVFADLYLLDKEDPPQLLATWPENRQSTHSWTTCSKSRNMLVPVFLFGKAHALLFHPAELRLTPANYTGTWATALAGLLLTALLTLYTATISGHRARLAREVARQTAALQESEARLRMAITAGKQGVYDANLQTGETFVDGQYASMLEYDPADFHETVEDWKNRLHPDDLETVSALFQAYTEGKKEKYRVEFRLRTKSGGWKSILSTGEIVAWDGEGRPLRMLGTHTDITEIRVLEEQLRQSQKMESVGLLAGGVAHDFNNMLQAILGYCELIIEDIEPDSPIHENLIEIQSAARRSADLTRQLLAFARKQTAQPKVLDLNRVIEDMLKMLRRLIGEDIDLVWRPGHGLWPILMDPSQVDQIMANLTVNARDAISGAGLFVIETNNRMLGEDAEISCGEMFPGPHVVLTVTDNGKGMDEKTADRIFEPFFTTKGLGKGTGLGLSTVYGIVRQNRGCVCVHSAPGKGSTFTICLPRAEPRGEIPATPESSPERGSETVLIAEDEETVLKLAGSILRQYGYNVLTAESPAKAMMLADSRIGPLHLLITDVVMPEMNGRELALKVSGRHPGVRILFMSGHTADVITRQGILAEGDDFIQKPFTVKGFSAKVREVLNRG